jgi:hypothetical protein
MTPERLLLRRTTRIGFYYDAPDGTHWGSCHGLPRRCEACDTMTDRGYISDWQPRDRWRCAACVETDPPSPSALEEPRPDPAPPIQMVASRAARQRADDAAFKALVDQHLADPALLRRLVEAHIGGETWMCRGLDAEGQLWCPADAEAEE